MISKIDGPGSVRPPSYVRRVSKTGKSSGTKFASHLEGVDETEGTSGTSATSSLGAVSDIFSLQEVDDALARAAKGKLRAQDILDRLDELRLEILNGTITLDKLRQLSHIVNSHRPEVTDPQLGEILDEIDLRAQIELAKFSARSSDF